MQDTRTPFLLNCVENGINIVLALALYPLLRRRRASRCPGRSRTSPRWSSRSWRCAGGSAASRAAALPTRSCASCVATVVLAALAWSVATVIGYGTPARAIAATVVALLVGGVGMLATLQLLHVAELGLLRDAVRRRPLRAADDPV